MTSDVEMVRLLADSECRIKELAARLAAADARHEADAKLLAEHAKTIKHYREKYEQEREDRQKAEARQFSVGAEHLREYAARVRERDEARQRLAAAQALLGRTADGKTFGRGSKVYYQDPVGYVQGLDVAFVFRTDSSVPEIVHHPYPVFSSHEAAATGGRE